MRRIWNGSSSALVVVIGLGVAGWYFFLKTDPEPRAAIKETPVVTESTVAGRSRRRPRRHVDGGTRRRPTTSWATASPRSSSPTSSETEATGRTNNVTASMTIDGTTVSDVTVTADLRDLTSDNSFRDGRIRSDGLESDQFPEAKFVLTEPITLPHGAGRRRDDHRPRPRATSPCTASPRR